MDLKRFRSSNGQAQASLSYAGRRGRPFFISAAETENEMSLTFFLENPPKLC